MDSPDLSEKPNIHVAMHFCLDVIVDLDRLTILLQSDPNADDTAADTIFLCWNAVSRATERVDGIVRRNESGKSFQEGS